MANLDAYSLLPVGSTFLHGGRRYRVHSYTETLLVARDVVTKTKVDMPLAQLAIGTHLLDRNSDRNGRDTKRHVATSEHEEPTTYDT